MPEARRKSLLAVIELMDHARLPTLYQQIGYEVSTEWSVREAVSTLRKLKPDVIVADFYFQSDFRDRLSNLESLLATAQPLTGTKILVLYESRNQPALERVRERMRINAAITTPVKEAELRELLQRWFVDANENDKGAEPT